MKNSFFDIYGVLVQLTSGEDFFSWSLDQLEQDFDFFKIKKASASPDVRVEFHNLSKGALPATQQERLQKSHRVLKTRMCFAFQSGSTRICQYDNQTYVFDQQQGSIRQAQIFSLSPSQSYLAAYYFLLSSIGELLDTKKIHRLHAVAIQDPFHTICLPLDSGQGKTTRALQALVQSDKKILGDEIILTDGKKIYPFPLRMAVRPEIFETWKSQLKLSQEIDRQDAGIKYLVPIPQERVGKETNQFELQLKNPVLFLFKFAVGLGVPQMREYMLRPGQINKLTKIFFFRLVCGIRLILLTHQK